MMQSKVAKPLFDKTDLSVIKESHENAGCSISDIASKLKMNVVTIRNRVVRLHNYGCVEMTKTRYKVTVIATGLGLKLLYESEQAVPQ